MVRPFSECAVVGLPDAPFGTDFPAAGTVVEENSELPLDVGFS